MGTQTVDKREIVTFRTDSSSPDIYHKRLKEPVTADNRLGWNCTTHKGLESGLVQWKPGHLHRIKIRMVSYFQGVKIYSLKTTNTKFHNLFAK